MTLRIFNIGGGSGPQPRIVQGEEAGRLAARRIGASDERLPDRPLSGYISGTVIHQAGVAVGARVRLTGEDRSLTQESIVRRQWAILLCRSASWALRVPCDSIPILVANDPMIGDCARITGKPKLNCRNKALAFIDPGVGVPRGCQPR